MSQAGCNRAKAATALKENDGDLPFDADEVRQLVDRVTQIQNLSDATSGVSRVRPTRRAS